jgi:hypothetical protein
VRSLRENGVKGSAKAPNGGFFRHVREQTIPFWSFESPLNGHFHPKWF